MMLRVRVVIYPMRVGTNILSYGMDTPVSGRDWYRGTFRRSWFEDDLHL